MGACFSSYCVDRVTEDFWFVARSYALVVRRHVVRAYNDGLDREKKITERTFSDEYAKFDADRMTRAFDRVGVPVSLAYFLRKAIRRGPTSVSWEAPSVHSVLASLDDVRALGADKRCFRNLVASTISHDAVGVDL